ncbi:MAG: hypothetical protein HYV28_17645 [Ignavibacteriales bacterium]|nr:hypothetical protein [Ignavibacteriales bacterium]
MNSLFYKFLNDDDLLRISHVITDMEKITSGEIVVSIKEKRGLFQRGKTIRQLAEKEFTRLKMNVTRDRSLSFWPIRAYTPLLVIHHGSR